MTRQTKTMKTVSAYGGANIESLMLMLETKRPHKSKSERRFISNFIEPIGVERDGFGNLYKRIPGAGDDILWSVHTDTVHSSGGRQLIRKQKGMIRLHTKAKANCLGADDTAGIWLALEMIAAKKPGLYIFHRAEEIGGLGSDFIATHNTELLKGIRIAIALDRKGYGDVITYQGSRGCSEAFAESLCAGLNTGHNLSYTPDPTGLFTDTANYFDLIPECTNISVGYFAAHSAKEYQDSEFLVNLRAALIALDTVKLIVERNPEESAFDDYYDDNLTYTDPNRFDSLVSLHADGAKAWDSSLLSGPTTIKEQIESINGGVTRTINRPIAESTRAYLVRAIQDNPETIADLLDDYGIGLDEILQLVYDKTGTVPY